jgi:predicted metal-dependent RNase
MDYIDVLQRNGVQPPFTAKGVKEAVKHSITLDYNEVSDVGPDVRLTFHNAGHLLGSAQVHLHVGQGLHNIVYTGDFKFGRTRLFDSAFTNFQRIETLITESTYGGPSDIMPHRGDSEGQLLDIVNQTMEKKGQVIIPSFAVGRAQEVMAILSENKFEYPVFIDGMIWDATAIHTAYPEYLSKDMERRIFQGENPLMSDIFKRITSSKEREKVWDEKPSVIITTSGMLTGGPAMEHLKALGEGKENTLLFVGYQGEGTMGRRIQKGWRELPLMIKGKTKTMKLGLEVATIEGLSGHSDKNQILNYVHRLRSKPERIIFCHGDNTKPVNMARTMHKLFRVETLAPKNLEAVRLR